MLDALSLEDFIALSKKGSRIALYQEIASDFMTPITVFQALAKPGGGSALLESAEKDAEVGRMSFLGLFPLFRFEAKGTLEGDPLEQLRALLKAYRCINPPEKLPPLAGGAIGFLSYDAVRLFEKIPDRHPDPFLFPDLFFQFYEVMIVFQHHKGSVIFSKVVEVGEDAESDYRQGMQELQALIEKASCFERPKPESRLCKSECRTDVDELAFSEKVARVKEHICCGDAFQVVISRCFEKKITSSPFTIYRALRCATPSPFMFFIDTPEFAIAGASPERLASLRNGIVETMPIAGTRPRGEGEADFALEQELLADEKEKAEHMMLVDLGRNDVGRVSEPGSVAVKELKTVHRFSHVMHLVSRVQGKLKEGLDALDVLRAVFPAGTLTGAPKIRAMEIINALEESRREIYGGAICSIDSLGNLDSCIAIRTALIREGVATVRTGAGIVFDSDPLKEAEETRHKAKGVLSAIQLAEEGKL